MAPVVAAGLSSLIVWPADTRHVRRVGSGQFVNATCAVDTMNIVVPKPADVDFLKQLYSVKAYPTKCAYKFQTVAGFDGRIWNADGAHLGSTGDITILRRSGMLDKLNDHNRAIGDSAYTGERYVYVSKKRPPHGELTAEQKASNHKLHQLRAIVENVHARLRDWAIVREMYRGDPHNPSLLGDLVRSAYSIANLTFARHPVRVNVRSIAHPRPSAEPCRGGD
jgi:hypothetical protein